MPNTTKRLALPAGDLPLFHLFLVKTVLFIAVTASKLSVHLAATVATTHAATVEAPMAVAGIAATVMIDVTAATIAILVGKIL